MPWSWTPRRSDARELMDEPGLPEFEIAEAYHVLRRVNAQLGNLWTASREIQRSLDEDGPWRPGESVSILDVGSGSGDLPRALRERIERRGRRATVSALDRDAIAVTLARRSGIPAVRADSLRIPFADGAFDLVTAVKFAHHFTGASLVRMVGEMARVARRRVLILDIRRHWLAYYGFVAWSRAFTKNRLVRHDGPLSVLKGFTATELQALGAAVPGFEWTVRPYLGFQLALVGRRVRKAPSARHNRGQEASRAPVPESSKMLTPALNRSPVPSRVFDVAIVGAGLAGGSLALRLARAGVKVALIDQTRFPRDKLCGEFLSPECWGVFERLRLRGDVERLGYHPIRRVRITTPHGRALEADFTDPDGLPGIGLGRSALDDLIAAAARAAGVEMIDQARVKEPFLLDGRVAGVVARRGADEPFVVRATVTIAADGRHSALVQRTGTTATRSWFRPRYFGLKRHLHVSGSDPEPDGMVGLHLVAGGYVGTCRIETGMTNLCGLLPESVLKKHRGDLDRLAERIFPGNDVLGRLWHSARPAGEWKTVADVRVGVSTPTLPGVLYAGDSQGTIDPLGGQGMTLALLGAEMLAPFVTRALAAGCVGGTLQKEYAADWHRRFDRRITLCRAFHHVLIHPWLVDAGSRFSAVAPRLLALCYSQTRDSRRAAGTSRFLRLENPSGTGLNAD